MANKTTGKQNQPTNTKQTQGNQTQGNQTQGNQTQGNQTQATNQGRQTQGAQGTNQNQATNQTQGKQTQANQTHQARQQSMQGESAQGGTRTEFDATYWRNQYQNEPYYNQASTFGDYEPAYRLGTEARQRYSGQRFDEVENELRSEYEASHGSSKLGWKDACDATRAAWDRTENMNVAGRDRKQEGI